MLMGFFYAESIAILLCDWNKFKTNPVTGLQMPRFVVYFDDQWMTTESLTWWPVLNYRPMLAVKGLEGLVDDTTNNQSETIYIG